MKNRIYLAILAVAAVGAFIIGCGGSNAASPSSQSLQDPGAGTAGIFATGGSSTSAGGTGPAGGPGTDASNTGTFTGGATSSTTTGSSASSTGSTTSASTGSSTTGG